MIDTNEGFRCGREEVADEVVALLRPILLAAITTGRHVALPDFVRPRCTITASCGSRSRALLVTVWGPPAPSNESVRQQLTRWPVKARAVVPKGARLTIEDGAVRCIADGESDANFVGMAGEAAVGGATDRAVTVGVSFSAPTPIVTLGVAPTSIAGADLWPRIVPGGGEEQLPRPSAPPVPWCVAKLQPTALLWSEAVSWLGDFERCIAWAWVDVDVP